MPPTTQRAAADIFSTAMFRPILRDDSTARIDAAIHELRTQLPGNPHSNRDVINAAYEELASSYRSEYVYKNLIASKLLVGRHRASNASLITEFKVGSAIADCVFINGNATVYEIKTELDSWARLNRQLSEYLQAFPTAYVVVHESAAQKYSEYLDGNAAGLISIGRRRRMSIARPAQPTFDKLRTKTMFDALRVREIEDILRTHGLDVPDTPNGLRYVRYLAAAEALPPGTFHQSFIKALKNRRTNRSRDLLLDPNVSSLRAIVSQLDPNEVQVKRLLTWLGRSID